jgi:hypothetical protein
MAVSRSRETEPAILRQADEIPCNTTNGCKLSYNNPKTNNTNVKNRSLEAGYNTLRGKQTEQ